ncbi:MAG: hypothetical protein ACOZAQ_02060 [Pseudomonadota bacterium]
MNAGYAGCMVNVPSRLARASMLRTFLLLAGVCTSSGVWAAEPDVSPTQGDEPWYDRAHAGASDWLVGAAARLDSFFGDPRAIEEDYSETYIRLRVGMGYSRLDETEWLSQAYAKVPLPRLSRRLNLYVSGGAEDESLAADPKESLQKTERSTSLGVQYVLDDSARGRWSLIGSFDPSLKLRYRYLQPLGSDWYARYTQTFYWDEDKDTGAALRGDIERLLRPDTLLRFTLDGDYWDGEDGLRWTAGGALLQKLDARAALAYDLSVRGVSRPDWVIGQYRAGVRYRRNFFRSWMFYEIEPALRWSRDTHVVGDRMRFDPVIFMRLEFQFGDVRGL